MPLFFFSLMKRLISALNLRFAYVIMAARTEEAINSPKCSSVAVTLKMPSQFEPCFEWWVKTTSIPGIFFTHLMRWTASSTSWGTCDLGNYWRTCFPSPPLSSFAVRSYLKALWLNSLSFRLGQSKRLPNLKLLLIDKQSSTPLQTRSNKRKSAKGRFSCSASVTRWQSVCASQLGNNLKSASLVAVGRRWLRAESTFVRRWRQSENDRDRVETSSPMTKRTPPVWPTH